MRNKNILIVVLMVFGAVLFSLVQFVVVPHNKEMQRQYAQAQLDAITQDINYILPYKNEYMGDNSNIVALFRHLPLSTTETKFELFPDILTVQVDYQDTYLHTGKESMSNKSYMSYGSEDALNEIYDLEVKKSLLYNSTAAFVLIGNLEHIQYTFSDVSYEVSRDDIEALYKDFGNILNQNNWKNEVQNKLNDSSYLESTAKAVLIEKSNPK